MPQPQARIHRITQRPAELKTIIETPRTLLPEPPPEIDIVKWVCDGPGNGHGGEIDVLCFMVVVFGVEDHLTCCIYSVVYSVVFSVVYSVVYSVYSVVYSVV